MKTLILMFCLVLTICKSTPSNNEGVNTRNPEYKAYMAQEHRFALEGCELTYNEKPFALGMTLQEAEQVFGMDYNIEQDVIEYNNSHFILWHEDNKISGIKLFLNKVQQTTKIHNIFLKNEDRMQDFIKFSKYSFEDFSIKSEGYILKNEECGFKLQLDSPVAYERIGSGHIYTRGDWLLDKTKPVEAISIYKITE